MCEIAIEKMRILSILLTFYAPESIKNKNDEKYNILNFALQIVKKRHFLQQFWTKKSFFGAHVTIKKLEKNMNFFQNAKFA